jgi:formylglycine-generating enzyme required for sulfatase activity
VAEFQRLLLAGAGRVDHSPSPPRRLVRIALAVATVVVLLVSAATVVLTNAPALTGGAAMLDATMTPLAPTPRLDGARLPTAVPALAPPSPVATLAPLPTIAPAPTSALTLVFTTATPAGASVAPASSDALATDAAGEWLDVPAGNGLAAFRIMRTEVTNAQYAACIAAGACEAPYVQPFPAGGEEERRKYFAVRWNDPAFADHPVLWVTREQARVYAAWRGAALPNAAQWRRACQGDDGRLYPWGNAAASPELSNYWDPARDPTPDDKDHGDTLPVGSLPAGASPFGVLDMSGNVWEWVDDGTNQVRGGSFYNEADTVRCDSTGQPLQRLNLGGFRLVRAAP